MPNQSHTLENLQKALSMETTAIHQYLLHTHVLADWGLDLLSARMRQEMNEELGHASRFIDRILFLEAAPRIEASKTPRQSDSLDALFTADLKEENAAIDFYSQAARDAAEDQDIGTRVLFEQILIDEEGHKDWLSRQLALLQRMGEPTYMLKNMDHGGTDV